MTPVRALGLVSGGLDSAVAVRLLQNQGAEVTALYVDTPFLDDTTVHETLGRVSHAQALAFELGVPFIRHQTGPDYLQLVKYPPHGWGSDMNPCLDCHVHFLKVAKEYREKEGFDFVFTGEVVGQRPMSQLKNLLRHVEKASGLDGLLLRPLSAKLLPETLPEQRGQVDRDALLDISGRGRSRQIALASQWGLRYFSAPAGGCLLTQGSYSRRLYDLLCAAHPLMPSPGELALLPVGRHVRLPDGRKYVAGRRAEENERLFALSEELGFVLFSPEGFSGPSVLVASPLEEPTPREVCSHVHAVMAAWGKPGQGAGDPAMVEHRPGRPPKVHALVGKPVLDRNALAACTVDDPDQNPRRAPFPLT